MNLVSFFIFFFFFALIVFLLFMLGKKDKKINISTNNDKSEIFLRYSWFTTFLPSLTLIICILFFWTFVYFESEDREILIKELLCITSSVFIIFLYLKKAKVLKWK
jgi:hypothetical protein